MSLGRHVTDIAHTTVDRSVGSLEDALESACVFLFVF